MRRVVQARPKPRPVETAAVAPPQQQQQTIPLTDIPKESAARLVMDEAAQARSRQAEACRAQARTAQAHGRRQAAPAQEGSAADPAAQLPPDSAVGLLAGSQTQMASVAPPPSASGRNSILFAPGAEEPPQSALEAVRNIAPGLSSALWSGAAHIQLDAYGGAQNDKGSDARRLSLKRALIIRQLLIDDGIPSERIVVRAMGGAPSGALDRVDIFVAA